MRWSELLRRQPHLTSRAEERLIAPGVMLVVTLRRDGTPPLSPVESFLLDGRLLSSMLWGSCTPVTIGATANEPRAGRGGPLPLGIRRCIALLVET
jgi:hypothetical protein